MRFFFFFSRAVSSSVGSNIFDVCVGLPVPWLLYAIINQEAIQVNAKGMLCSVSILFGNYNNYSEGRCMAIC
jgi:sodium/potassium/calcium exchanger 2